MTVVAVLMFGFGFAMAPLYDVLCEVTGIGGKVKNEASEIGVMQVDPSREITLEFITSVNERMPLDFRVEQSKLKIHPGQFYTIKFYAENTSDKKLIGQAIPSVVPVSASKDLKKSECFCFTEQEFEPHKLREMPVRFTIDPTIAPDVKDMTLSYTFFDITEKK